MLECTTDMEYAVFENSQCVLKDVTDAILGCYTALSVLHGEPIFEAYQLGPTSESHVEQLMQGIVFPVGATVVDVGCGVGTVTRLLQGWRPDLRCLNLNLSLAQLRYCKHPLINADGHALPLMSACADVVFLLYVLGYGLLEPFLREAARITKPGGVLCIYDLWSIHPQRFLQQTGYASHHPSRVLDVAQTVGWTLTQEVVPQTYPSNFFLQDMGKENFNALFGDCHPALYRGVRHA